MRIGERKLVILLFLAAKCSATRETALIKISQPERYVLYVVLTAMLTLTSFHFSMTSLYVPHVHSYVMGDVVLFYKTQPLSNSAHAALLHAKKPYPHILMDVSSYASFGIKSRRM